MSDYYNDSPSNDLDFLTSDSQAYIKVGNIELKKSIDTISGSNLVINEWVRRFENISTRYPQIIPLINPIKQSLLKSFKVESNIASVLQRALDDYPNIEMTKFEILIEKLVNQRMSIAEDRVNLISKLSFN